jgi:hypothetical protein
VTQIKSAIGWARVAVCGALLVAIAGCGGGSDSNAKLAEVNSNSMQRLANLYFTFQLSNDFRGPKDEAELKTFIAGINPEKLTLVGVDPNAIDVLFVSPRDNQPFKIRYGVKGSAMGSSEPVIFEAVGVDGKREVGFLNMTQREVDAGEYDALLSGKGAPAAPVREH